MAVSAAVAAAKVAATVLSSDKLRKTAGWIIAAILSPLILILVLICSMLSGTADHNNAAVSSLLSKKFTDKMLRTAISKYLKSEGRTVAPETILNYIKACEDAFLFYRVRRQDLQGKKILTVNEKYYIADHGIREAVFGGNMKDINLIFENIVYIELLRRGYKVTVGKAGEKKIDFIAEKQTQKLYVQVAYLLASEETIQREFGAYDTIRDNFPKYVVSYDEFDMSRDGLKHMNIREFLLSKQWD